MNQTRRGRPTGEELNGFVRVPQLRKVFGGLLLPVSQKALPHLQCLVVPTDCPLVPRGYRGASAPCQTIIQQGLAAWQAGGVPYDEPPTRWEGPLVWSSWDSVWILARISLEFLWVP